MIEKKKKAVVIDDEPDILVYLSTALENNGFEVFSISNSNEGIRIIREYVPDLLCLDILMPGKTGLSIYNEIKKDKQLADIPVIIISGLNMKDDVLDENNSCYNKNSNIPEPDAYIEKPIDIEYFIRIVKEIT